jgi:hypothetical protein
MLDFMMSIIPRISSIYVVNSGLNHRFEKDVLNLLEILIDWQSTRGFLALEMTVIREAVSRQIVFLM